ncbi:MAG TPA: glycosyltransferase [Bryobacteraceae bacterium]|jgi:spore maturation protein CgeB
MRVVIFTHSLISDWNHGNAHFLRGVAAELIARGHDVRILEPRDGWSLQNLLAEYGVEAIQSFHRAFPDLRSRFYDAASLDADRELEGAGLVIVHEWNSHDLVRRLGEHRARNGNYGLLFHDTHHRSVTDRSAMEQYDLSHYDGVLAYGNVIRDIYRGAGWCAGAWTWHEAADTRIFYPRTAERAGDLVWIGNWGDGERSEELEEFLIQPVKALGLRARVYGVRYPAHALDKLARAGIEYGGWLPNYQVPEVFAQFRVTIHIPRRPYVRALPGIPTIRVFEALACGIPLISTPWDDCEHLFAPGRDYLVARDGGEMRLLLKSVLSDEALARRMAAHGLATIRSRHTCGHRVDELLNLVEDLPHADRIFRFEPGIGLLERSGHVLPRDHSRPGSAGTPGDIL